MAKQSSKSSAKSKTSKTKQRAQITSRAVSKTSNEKKQFFLIRWIKNLAKYIAGSYKELKKVSWPSKKELVKGTGIVLVIIAIFTVVIYVFDTVFSLLTQWIYSLT